ncbi:hypothetical protein DMB66_11230 [Actinoplanes sp. ATCC 53533]|nr:hypothetical protein DMB66_11230 [Actinoplanes sp. ATCC 53533]
MRSISTRLELPPGAGAKLYPADLWFSQRCDEVRNDAYGAAVHTVMDHVAGPLGSRQESYAINAADVPYRLLLGVEALAQPTML